MVNKAGIIILSGFAVIWLVFAKINGAPIPWLLMPLAAGISALLVRKFLQQKPAQSFFPLSEQKRIGRVFMWSSIGEGIGIFFVINILANVGMADRYMAGIALIVGLHFIPIAWGVPMRIAFVQAAILLALSAAGFLITSPSHAALIVGFGGAATLWFAAVASIVKLQRQDAAV